MELSEKEKQAITRSLKKRNRYIWKDEIIISVISVINKLRNGEISKDDWFYRPILTYESYLYQINLIKYL